MKTLRLFSAVSLLAIFFTSCAEQTNYVAYFIDSTLQEKLIVNTTNGLEETQSTTRFNVDVGLTSSESFKTYLDDLTALEVVSITYKISNSTIDVSNATVMLDGLILPNFASRNNSEVVITDDQLLLDIADKLLKNQKINFAFESSFTSEVDFVIDVMIDVKGTFVN